MSKTITWNNNNVDQKVLQEIGRTSNRLVFARVVPFTEDLSDEQKKTLLDLGVYVNETARQRTSYYAGYRAGLTHERLHKLIEMTAPISVPDNESWTPFNIDPQGKLIARIMYDRQRQYPLPGEGFSDSMISELCADVLYCELVGFGWLSLSFKQSARGKTILHVTIRDDSMLIQDRDRFAKLYAKPILRLAKTASENLTEDIVKYRVERKMVNDYSDEALALVCEKLSSIKKIVFAGITTRTPGPNLP